jgi:hypothetical protein
MFTPREKRRKLLHTCGVFNNSAILFEYSSIHQQQIDKVMMMIDNFPVKLHQIMMMMSHFKIFVHIDGLACVIKVIKLIYSKA